MYTIGFANLTEEQGFCRLVRASFEAAARQNPNVQLIVRNNEMNNNIAMANIREFAESAVDLAVIYHIDERFNPELNRVLMQQRIPVIAVDIPIPLTVYFGVNNKQAGILAGAAVSQWVTENWGGQVDKVMVVTDSRVLDVVRRRLDFALDALIQTIRFNREDVFFVDGANQREMSYERVLSVLERWSDYHRIVILGINDDSVMGAIDAARELGREQDVVGVGQGANLIEDGFSRSDSRFMGSVVYHPEKYGEQVLDLAQRMLNGERVPRENFIDHVVITRENMHLLNT